MKTEPKISQKPLYLRYNQLLIKIKTKTMITINDMKVSLINLIGQSDDFNMIATLFKKAKSLEQQKTIIEKEKPDFREAIVEWQDEDATFEDAIKGQEHKGLTFEDFRELQEDPNWEYSLDELLEALD